MYKIFLLLILFSCSHKSNQKPPIPDGLVTIETAVDHLTASYLKGCVDAFHALKIPKSFHHCRTQAEIHRKDVQHVLDQE